jgi:orotidine-5'-phosphate decarboxylase
MFVLGGTRPEVIKDARRAVPSHFFLVPGIGAQGGDLEAVLDAGLNTDGGLLINSSRGILQAGSGDAAVPKARQAAKALQRAMESALRQRGFLG